MGKGAVEEMKKVLSKLDNRVLAIGAAVLFLLSMLPIWYLARYARPSGDDYGYSYLTHAAWLDTHSLAAVFRAGVQTVKINYNTWNGDWFTTFLFSLMPEVFVPWSFWIVPLFMTGILIAATSFFLWEVCIRIFKMGKAEFVLFDCILLFASFQYIPSTAIGMYWYVGATHYILPHAVLLATLVFGWRFWERGKIRYLTAACLGALLIGGSSYFSALLLFLLYAVLMVLGFPKNRKVLWLLLPWTICFVGFVIQCLSPGNAVRGGAGFGLHAGAVVQTVFTSLLQGVRMIGVWMGEKPLVFVLLLLLAVFGWEALLQSKTTFRFPCPALALLFLYGCYSSQFAPEIYSAVEVSLGPATMQYFTFLLSAAVSVFYLEGWLIGKLRGRKEGFWTRPEKWRLYVVFPALLLCLLVTLLRPGWLGDSVDRRACEYVLSGRAEDFREQIASQMELLLDDSVREVYLVPTNDDQGPLMHMPVTNDENAFTNWAVRCFYRKDKVVTKTE